MASTMPETQMKPTDRFHRHRTLAASNMGRSAHDIVEAGAGGEYHRALALHALDGEAEMVEGEFAYDTDDAAQELRQLPVEHADS